LKYLTRRWTLNLLAFAVSGQVGQVLLEINKSVSIGAEGAGRVASTRNDNVFASFLRKQPDPTRPERPQRSNFKAWRRSGREQKLTSGRSSPDQGPTTPVPDAYGGAYG
jgi:hypothetical protein